MKKLLKIVFVLTLLFGSGVFAHSHDDKCGYDPITKLGCCYEISLYQDQGPGI